MALIIGRFLVELSQPVLRKHVPRRHTEEKELGRHRVLLSTCLAQCQPQLSRTEEPTPLLWATPFSDTER